MIFLSEKEGPYYYNKTSPTRLELEECIHFHHGAFRFVWSTEEFKKIASIFSEAFIKISEMGWPEYSEEMRLLCGENIEVLPLQYNRWAIEITSSNLVHIHIGNLRLRLTPLDFEWLANMFKEALVEFYQYEKQKINLLDDNIIFPTHVRTKYLRLLDEYKSGKHNPVKPTEVGKLRAEVKWHIRYPKHKQTSEEDLVRSMEKPFTFVAGTVPKKLDTKYLFAIYESIREWGYADGPFYGELLSVLSLPDGRLQVTDAHRVAALLSLGYNEIDVFVSKPRDDFRWQ